MSASDCAPSGPDSDYEGKSAMRTLQEAETIKSNPGLHRRAMGHAKRQLSSLKKLTASKPMSKGRR